MVAPRQEVNSERAAELSWDWEWERIAELLPFPLHRTCGSLSGCLVGCGNNISSCYIIAIPARAAMRRREWDNKLYEIAETQVGYFSASQAREAGVNPITLVQLAERRDIERVSRGIYRLSRFPISPLGQYMEATLWPQVRRSELRAVVSHVSALSLYELSDVSPATVHITLPPNLRIRREVPKYLTIHRAELGPKDVQLVNGITVTTPSRTIRDVHASHIGAALVRQAIADGRRNGQLTHDQADELKRELLEGVPTAGPKGSMHRPKVASARKARR